MVLEDKVVLQCDIMMKMFFIQKHFILDIKTVQEGNK